jgi:lysophospholipase L1-like esterase
VKHPKTVCALWAALALLGVSLGAQAQSVTIQENALGFCRVQGTVDSNHTGFTGSGFANADNAGGSGIDWTVSVAASGVYLLEWRFANGSTARPGSVRVNGANVATVDFPSTGVWTSWTTVSRTVNLAAGRNSIRLEATTAAGLANVDSLTISGSGGVQAADCDAATAIMIEENTMGFCGVDGTIDSNHAGFTGSGFANTTNATGTGVDYAISIPAAGNYMIRFAYANGGNARSATVMVNGANRASLVFNSTGAWTSWTNTSAVTVPLQQGNNKLRLQAADGNGLANIDSLYVSGSGPAPGACGSNGPITLWIAGDSTVANGGATCPIGWGLDFKNYFNSNVTVQNLAVAGRSVRTWLYDVQSSFGGDGECSLNRDSSGNPILQDRWRTTLAGMKAGDYLFIQFGINDGDSSCPRHVGSEAFMQSYQMMAEAARQRGATPIFLTPVSAIRCSGSAAVATRGFLSETINLGARLGVPVIELHQRSINLYNQRVFCPIPGGGDVGPGTGGAVGAFFCDDHTHFSRAGANDIAALVVQGLRDLNLPLVQHLKATASGTANVFLAGDSIVQTYADTSSPGDQAGWGQMLHEQFSSNVNIHNHAIGGRTARRFIDEGRLNAIWTAARAGDYLLVQFGTNDGHTTATYSINGQTIPYYLDPSTDFKNYLLQYVNGARARGIHLAFVTPTPRNSAYCTGGNGTGAWAQAMRELASAERIPLIDLNRKTVDHLSAICPAPTPENFFFRRGDGSVDGTHFQENGARILARFVADGIGENDMALNYYRK